MSDPGGGRAGRTFKTDTFGIGPFVAVEAGADAVISSVGLGLLFAWKRSNNGSGFGLGFGYSAQPNTKVLGSEFVDGQPAPTDSTGAPLPIRYQQRDKGSLVLLLSALF